MSRDNIVVTGAAGFIGSHTSERLIQEHGYNVIGIDSFTPYYDDYSKRLNLEWLLSSPHFELVDEPIGFDVCRSVFDSADAVLHLAAQPGVRDSWDEFETYVHHNITATKALLDAAVACGVERVVYASSSSVYGDTPVYPTPENVVLSPRSPYGVTKLTGERLCVAYSHEQGLPTACLRYFTVYGPRQRPDMAIHRLIEAGLDGTAFPMFGDGTRVRDFTYVGDVVDANVLAATAADLPQYLTANICGGSPVDLNGLVAMVEEVIDRPIDISHRPVSVGDVKQTGGASARAREHLGWEPSTSLQKGIRLQADEISRRRSSAR